jgi:nitroreductase
MPSVETQLHPLIRDRRSARAFDPTRPVESGKLQALLEAARWAPSCSNLQPSRFIVCTGTSLDGVKECLNPGNTWAKRAPLIVAAAADAQSGCRITGRDYAPLDLGLAVENMILQGIGLGLAMHPIAGFDEIRLKTVLAVPDEKRVYALIIAGYPGSESDLDQDTLAKEHSPRTRKPATEILFWESWGRIAP